jgi:hypothetical protein
MVVRILPFMSNLRASLAVVALAMASVSAAEAAPPSSAHSLGQYNIDEGETSVSGISAGAFMAVQLGVAWSSIIKGVGAVAGGPFDCAHGFALAGIVDIPDVAKALGPCMVADPDGPNVEAAVQATRDYAAGGTIDDPKYINRQKIYLFDGYNDGVVRRKVVNALYEYYTHFVAPENRGNIYYQSDIGAGHALVTDHDRVSGVDRKALPCDKTGGNFIVDCKYDQAGVILQHIYGRLNPKNTGKLTGRLITFRQSDFVTGGLAMRQAASLGSKGYVYVPAACAKMAPCRVHIALHGCQQYAGAPDYTGIPPEPKDLDYVELTGYREWADTNNIIVLYPQTAPSGTVPFNPKGCWDWWGYTNGRYDTKAALQIKAIKATLDSMVDPKAVPGPVAAAPVSLDLAVSDTSDTRLALIWRPLPGIAAYQVYRKPGKTPGADGFEQIAVATGGSFGDTDLVPGTRYSYYLATPDGSNSQEVGATTRIAAAPCDPFYLPAISQLLAGRLTLPDPAQPYHYQATGSNQPVEVASQTQDVNLIQTKAGYFVTGTCPAG